MQLLVLALVGAAFVLKCAGAGTNSVAAPAAHASAMSAPEEKEYAKLLADNEAAEAEVQRWRAEYKELSAKGITASESDLQRRVRERLESVGKAYLDFLRRYPHHVQARLSYGCFLNDHEDEAGAQTEWEEALKLDPHNADAYNNLAGRYAEIGPARKAFDFFSKAIELKPSEAAYYHNFADALYVLRSHAMTNYGITEQQVFSRSLLLYSNAARLDPTNSTFSWDFAQTYYVIKPLPHEPALQAWTNALISAATQVDREQIYIHLARVKMLAGRLEQARAQLDAVTGEANINLKSTLLRAIKERQSPPSNPTNAP